MNPHGNALSDAPKHTFYAHNVNVTVQLKQWEVEEVDKDIQMWLIYSACLDDVMTCPEAQVIMIKLCRRDHCQLHGGSRIQPPL